MGRFIWVFGICLFIATLAGAAFYLNPGGVFQNGAKPVHVEDSLPPKIICIAFAGIEPGVINMHPVRGGEVTFVVAEGKTVKKDEVLLKLDDTLAQIKVEQAQAELNIALQLETRAKLKPRQHELQIKQLRAKIEEAKSLVKAAHEKFEQVKRTAERTENKLNLKQYEEELKAKEEGVKGHDASMDELKLDDPQIYINTAAENVAAKRLQLKEAKFGLTKCVLQAPADGTVLQVFVHANEVLGPSAAQPALIFAPNGPRIVRAEVIQEWASRVEIGQEAIVEDDTFRGPQWKGKVKQIAGWYSNKTAIREPFMMIDQRILQCIIEIDSDQSPPLKIGQRVRVSIVPTAK